MIEKISRLHPIFPKYMASWVVIVDRRVMEIVDNGTRAHTTPCSDPAWHFVRPRSWWWKTQIKDKKQSQKLQDWSTVHFGVR